MANLHTFSITTQDTMYIVVFNVSVFKHCIKLAKVTSYIHNPVQYTQVLQDILASVGGLAEQ